MTRRLVPVLLVTIPFLVGCAGPSTLARRSQDKLANGDLWRAWKLATQALDKAPGNASARAAAGRAAEAIASDWKRRIRALADVDSLAAAEQVLELASFRARAARYTTLPPNADWSREEQALRQTAARVHHRRGVSELASRRPKRAYLDLTDALRFVPDYRDATRLAEKAYEKALTRVAFVPFSSDASGGSSLGREVAAEWRDRLARLLVAPDAHFTTVLGSAAVEQQMNVSQLGHLSRQEAVSLGRMAGAERIVWGSIGDIETRTRLHLFDDVIARRIVTKDAEGHEVTRWVDVPIEVVARVRTVTVDVEYEVIATKGGATLAHQRTQRSNDARVVWTSYSPEGDLDSYALVSDLVRTEHPDRARAVEARWKDVCGEDVTVRQVFQARRSTRGAGHYDRGELGRFMAGAAFVFLQDLPPAEDLAFAALAGGWQPLRADLLRLDATDDVDLGMTAGADEAR